MKSYLGESTFLPSELTKSVSFQIARVEDVILNDSHKEYEKLGKEHSIGVIKYQLINEDKTTNVNSLSIAYPLLPFLKHYPIKYETVFIVYGLPSAKTDSKNSYSSTYYITDVNLFNNPQLNQLFFSQEEKKEWEMKNVNFTPLQPKEGDFILEGRWGNSIRMGNDGKGNSLTIINNRTNESGNGFVNENFEKDSFMLISNKISIPIIPAYTRLKSFDVELVVNKTSETINKNNAPSSDSKITNDETKLSSSEYTPIENSPTGSVKQEVFKREEFSESEESVLEVITPISYIDFLGRLENTSMEVIEGRLPPQVKPIKINSSTLTSPYVGAVDVAIPMQIRALLDTIAYCEGTLGQSKNGYDIIVGFGRNRALIVSDWNVNYTGGHPTLKLKDGAYFKGSDGVTYKLQSSASGRYQFIKGTWDLYKPSTEFNKKNQDLACDAILRRDVFKNYPLYYQFLHKYINDDNHITPVISQLSRQWDCFPKYPDKNISYYSHKTRFSMKDVRDIYNKCYGFYTNQ